MWLGCQVHAHFQLLFHLLMAIQVCLVKRVCCSWRQCGKAAAMLMAATDDIAAS